MVVAGCGLGVAFHETEPHEEWKREVIGLLCRIFEGMVETGALALLHEIKNVAAGDWMRTAEMVDAGCVNEGVGADGHGALRSWFLSRRSLSEVWALFSHGGGIGARTIHGIE